MGLLYGRYLLELLAGTAARSTTVSLLPVHDRTIGIAPGPGRTAVLALRGASGLTQHADAVVLALDSLPPSRPCAPRRASSPISGSRVPWTAYRPMPMSCSWVRA
ncbi:FAD/NAD(P)-binding protein [Streptomyces sp. ISL-100]|uniref:FAD/NAD(P)-binding protein n=1 Tax=Streptomyces sp. ISL-100 TaxID=2819173 RepID=UPI00203574C0|nr:FAD/NAD(P)-binding protein [Streptomyces sp. ISL-100]